MKLGLRRERAAAVDTNGATPHDDDLLFELLQQDAESAAEHGEAEAVREMNKRAREARLDELHRRRAPTDEIVAYDEESTRTIESDERRIGHIERRQASISRTILEVAERAEQAKCDALDAEDAADRERAQTLAAELTMIEQRSANREQRRHQIRRDGEKFRAAYDPVLAAHLKDRERQSYEYARWVVEQRPGTAARLAAQGDETVAKVLEWHKGEVQRKRRMEADLAERSFTELYGEGSYPDPAALARLRGEPVPVEDDPNVVRPGRSFPRVER